MEVFGNYDFQKLEQYLCRARVESIMGMMVPGTNYTFLLRLRDSYSDPNVLAVYKPVRGTNPLYDFPVTTLHKRELAAYKLSRYLGWPNIPPTVIRSDLPHGEGMLQAYIDFVPNEHYATLRERFPDYFMKVVVFDLITNNADRKSGHCLLDSKGIIWVIDHGLTFHVQPKYRSVIWDFAGQPLPSELVPKLQELAEDIEHKRGIALELSKLLSAEEVVMLGRRTKSILDEKWKFPVPVSYRQIPWPPL
jgi:uncharacterized repeat protein (TIGR03843 family)